MNLKKVIYFALLLLCSNIVYGQYFIFPSTEIARLEMEFLRNNIEAKAGETVFNVLKLVNQNQTQQSYTVNITYPSGWNIIGSDAIEVIVPPQDSVFIPIRIAVGGRVRGDIGYSIIAAAKDNRDNIIKNEYCFVKILKKTDTRIHLIDRINFIDRSTRASNIRIKVENRGNREELVNFLFEGERGMQIDQTRLSSLNKDYTITPYTDTILNINLFFPDAEADSRNLFRLNIKGSTVDTVFNATAWFNDIASSITNHIPQSQRILIAEVLARGMFSSYSNPTYATILEGNLLLKNDRDLFYFYQSDNLQAPDMLYKYNRMWLGYRYKEFQITAGDIIRNIESSMQGRGFETIYSAGKFSINSAATQNIRTEMLNAGASMNYRLKKGFSLLAGGAYNFGTRYSVNSPLGFIGSNFSLFDAHRFKVKGIFNPISFTSLNGTSYNFDTFGGELNYNSRIGNNRTSLTSRFGSNYLNNGFGGRTLVRFNSTQWFEDRSNIILRLNYSAYQRYTYRDNPEIIKPFNNNINGEIHYGRFVVPKVFLYAGPGFEMPSSDVFRTIETGEDFFGSRVANFTLGSRLVGLVYRQTINLQVIYGYVDTYNAPALTGDQNGISFDKPPFTYQHISGSIRNPKWSIQLMYTNGPRSIFEHYSWHYHSNQTRYLRLMPTFNSFLYKDMVRLESSVSYSNDLVSRSTYANITNQLYWYLPNNWQFRALNVYSLQSRVTHTEAIERFQNLYFEFSVRKEFDFQQPRQKFYDLDLVFFKDFNGNSTQEPNEPGIKNVLVNIQRIDQGTSNYASFVSAELLSDNFGRVSLSKIPAGEYEITFYPIGTDAGTFTRAFDDATFTLNKNTTKYIPFVEKNKVFGRIILNRSRLSGLGRVDVSNVRVTATDSQGRSFSTLTNKEGYFELFAPITDEYIVTINNIFYENFDLRQNNFLVQFNAYKQFEVNFVFDEKVRRIQFAATDQELESGIMQVRRTTISGSVKDANTQQPVRARVNLVNTRTNAVVQSTNSSATSGDYTMNFMAADSYLLEVLADDYWYFSENLVLQQVTTFLNITRNIQLQPISVGSKVELNIQFAVNSAYLAPESVAELNRLVRLLNNNPTVKLEIQGHCDDLEAIRQPGIALERANAIGTYLIENGYSNFEIKSFDNTVPAATNDTEEGRARNRRVEVEVLSR